jgi:hypothetical protein
MRHKIKKSQDYIPIQRIFSGVLNEAYKMGMCQRQEKC